MAYLKPAVRLWRPPWATGMLFLASGAGLVLPTAAAAVPPLEQAIKASFITKFPPFVEWPASAFASPSSPFTICLAGRDAFGSVIDEIARGQKVRGRPMLIRRVGDAPPLGGCHILVAGAGSSEGILDLAAGQPVLTVTDKSLDIDGGMIRFVRQAGRVRFEIDNGAARAARLTISSKLLGLAVMVSK